MNTFIVLQKSRIRSTAHIWLEIVKLTPYLYLTDPTVEEKGKEMEIEVREAATQAAFMLSEPSRDPGRRCELKKKRQEIKERRSVLGPPPFWDPLSRLG
jgi:hypothetical protein